MDTFLSQKIELMSAQINNTGAFIKALIVVITWLVIEALFKIPKFK